MHTNGLPSPKPQALMNDATVSPFLRTRSRPPIRRGKRERNYNGIQARGVRAGKDSLTCWLESTFAYTS